MKSSKRIIFLALFVSVIVIFAIVLISTILVFNNRSKSKDVDDFSYLKTTEYKVTRMNSFMNETQKGFVRTREYFERDSFSFKTERGSHVLLSKFGTKEYKCFGSCYCDEDSQRRRSSTITISRGLSYLVAAVTTTLAYKHSKQYFQQECEGILSEECSTPFIKSEVDDCQPLESEGKKKKVSYTVADPDFLVFEKYLCSGQCMVGNMLSSMFKKMPQLKMFIGSGCDTSETEGTIAVESLHDNDMDLLLAMKQFMDTYLRDMCQTVSDKMRTEYMDMLKNFPGYADKFKGVMEKVELINKTPFGQNLQRMAPMCVESVDNHNPSIVCELQK